MEALIELIPSNRFVVIALMSLLVGVLAALTLWLLIDEGPDTAAGGFAEAKGLEQLDTLYADLDSFFERWVSSGSVLVDCEGDFIRYMPKVINASVSRHFDTELKSLFDKHSSIWYEQHWVHPIMKLNLNAIGVEVTALSPYEQSIGESSSGLWQWKITPILGGNVDLHFSLSSIAINGGEVVGKSWPVITKTIFVKTSWWIEMKNFYATNWRKMLASILAGLIVAMIVFVLRLS